MRTAKDELLERLVSAGLEKCLLRLSETSQAAWKLGEVRVRGAGPQDAPDPGGREAVRITVGHPAPFATALLFTTPDSDHIYRCFVREEMAAALGPDRRLVTLLELGNITLNAVINSLLRALGKTAIPSVPEHLPRGANPFTPAPGAKPPFVTLTAEFSASGDSCQARLEAALVLPAALLAEL